MKAVDSVGQLRQMQQQMSMFKWRKAFLFPLDCQFCLHQMAICCSLQIEGARIVTRLKQLKQWPHRGGGERYP